MTKSIKCLFLFIIFSTTASFAQFTPEKDLPTDFVKSFPPPPKINSKEDKTDLATVLKYQKSRTAEDCERAESEEKVTLKTMFGKPYGTLTDEEVEKWSSLFEKIRLEGRMYAFKVKEGYKRPRPFVNHKEVQPCIKHEVSDSYPSGHSTIAYVFATVLSKIHPESSKEYLKRAEQIALDRVMGGVHYPHDIEAGKQMALIVMRSLTMNKQFNDEFAQIIKK